jgi:hypothetical protein
MRNSFVGLIRHHRDLELESLLPECGLTRRWLLDRSEQRRAACVWAVIDQSIADEITDLLADGEGVAALRFMASGATCMGPILDAREPDSAL